MTFSALCGPCLNPCSTIPQGTLAPLLALLAMTAAGRAAEAPAVAPDPSPEYRSPAEELKTFQLPPGYHLQLVASEPMIREPVTLAWDGNGRMFVAQMETYMQDVDGTGENEPTSRVMMLTDSDGDGKMDQSSVFIDKLVLPRLVLPLDSRVLITETYSDQLWSYRDTNNDGVADEKSLFTRALRSRRKGTSSIRTAG